MCVPSFTLCLLWSAQPCPRYLASVCLLQGQQHNPLPRAQCCWIYVLLWAGCQRMRLLTKSEARSGQPSSSHSLASLSETTAGRSQARNEVQRLAALLGAALVGHMTRLGAHLRDVEARKQRSAGPGHTGHTQRLGGLLPWRRRRGGHHDVGSLLCAPLQPRCRREDVLL